MEKCIICGSRKFIELGNIKNGDYAEKFLKEHSLIKCKKCGLISINPVPSKKILEVIYSNPEYSAWTTEKDSEKENIRLSNFKYYFKKIKRRIKKGKLLDCGCATGFFLDIARENKFDVYGIEISEIPFAIANKKHKDRIFEDDFEEIKIEKESFDLITMFDFIEHTINPRDILKKAHDILARGGFLVITTPDAGSMSMRIMKKSHTNYILEHLNIFNKKNISKLLSDLGFEIQEIIPARKILSLDYAEKVFKTHKNILWYPTHFLNSLIGKYKFSPIKISFGDMLIIARKK